MFQYFAYGSNMDSASLKAKGVVPLSSQKARLVGWRLCFNVQHFFYHEGGMANIEHTSQPNDVVLGVLHQLDDSALAALDDAEAYGFGYDRIQVKLAVGPHCAEATTYVGMPAFIDHGCQPTRRYLSIIVRGASAAKLDCGYIAALKAQPLMPIPTYPEFKAPTAINDRFTPACLARNPALTGLWGHVFDLSNARPLHTFLKTFFGGRDMTLFHIKRLDTSSGQETMDDVRNGRLNTSQREYLNAYLNEYANEYRYVGQLDYVN